MEAKTTNVRIEDLSQLKNDIELIKNVLLSEGELTDWARRAAPIPEKMKENLEFAKRTEEALERWDKGEFNSLDGDKFLKELEKW